MIYAMIGGGLLGGLIAHFAMIKILRAAPSKGDVPK